MFIKENKAMLPAGINQWLTDQKLKIEIVLTLLSAIGILVHSFEKEVGGDIVVTCMITQAVFYFILGYTTPDMEGPFAHLMYKVISISSAMPVIGLLFSIMRYDGDTEMILIGFNSMLFSVPILLYCVFRRWTDKLWPLLTRIGALAIITGLIRFNVIIF